jgi:site-specific DNA-methyltransferase (adenine-specific)
LDGGLTVTVHHGDCLDVLVTLDADSIDAVVTDPPYGIDFMGKSWDAPGVAFASDTWRAVLRVMKPGAYLVAFGGSRTSHRMACAIEDAGFELRNTLMWLYGSGFPKSRNIGNGWGTALKPAHEPIILARKPLGEATVAANVLRHGTGAINVDACRVSGVFASGWSVSPGVKSRGGIMNTTDQTREAKPDNAAGRWPANVLHDGSPEVLDAFAQFGQRTSGELHPWHDAKASDNGSMSGGNYPGRIKSSFGGDTGTAARFYYAAKASPSERAGSKHPTIKPLALIRWLVRLITPPDGVCLDPFAGSGTTGQAAQLEHRAAILIEREAAYVADIHRRLGTAPRKAAPPPRPPQPMPLFEWAPA